MNHGKTMRAIRVLALILLVGSLFITTGLSDVYYTANSYPFTFPTYGTDMGFDTDMVFDTAYRESDYWYFNTSTISELFGFQLQGSNARLLITDYFVADANVLTFDVTAGSGVPSTTKLYIPSKGEPTTVSGATSWSYDVPTKILTINIVHTSTVGITVTWAETPDTEEPTYNYVAHNTTIENQPCEFSCRWQDNIGLSGYIFNCNITGEFVDDAWVAFSTNPDWANVTKILLSAPTKIAYCWAANDTSDNWGGSSLFILTITAIGQDIVVLLNTPSNDTTLYTNSVTFSYQPIFSGTIENASVWLNSSGTWQAVAWNASSVQNGTLNSISYTVSNSGLYIWNIGVYNSTDLIFAEYNRTLTMALDPRVSDLAYSSVYIEQSCIFSSLWRDGDGMSGVIFSWNGSETWENDTWSDMWDESPVEATAIATKTLPASEMIVSFQFYGNDTDNNWVASEIASFVVVPQIATMIRSGATVVAQLFSLVLLFQVFGVLFNRKFDRKKILHMLYVLLIVLALAIVIESL